MIIGLSGKIGVGKTEIAKRICSYSQDVSLLCFKKSFGDHLKNEVAKEFGISIDYMYSQKDKNRIIFVPWRWQRLIHGASWLTGLSFGLLARIRTVLQWYGTEYMRKKDPDYWVKFMKSFYDHTCRNLQRDFVLIVDDVRFPNEKDLIRHLGGLNIKILPWSGWFSGPYAQHASETALDNEYGFDLVIPGPKWSSLDDWAARILDLAYLKMDSDNLDASNYFNDKTLNGVA